MDDDTIKPMDPDLLGDDDVDGDDMGDDDDVSTKRKPKRGGGNLSDTDEDESLDILADEEEESFGDDSYDDVEPEDKW